MDGGSVETTYQGGRVRSRCIGGFVTVYSRGQIKGLSQSSNRGVGALPRLARSAPASSHPSPKSTTPHMKQDSPSNLSSNQQPVSHRRHFGAYHFLLPPELAMRICLLK